MEQDIKKTIESLSLNERKILPLLESKNIKEVVHKSSLDETSVLRALEFLSNKDIVKIKKSKLKEVVLGLNGVLYLKNGLPERKLLNILIERAVGWDERKALGFSDNEFKASIGALKKKALIEVKNNKIFLNAKKEEVMKKMLVEKLLEALPISYGQLKPEEEFALNSLINRKDIIRIEEKNMLSFELTDFGKKIHSNKDIEKISEKVIEKLTPEVLTKGTWQNKTFRRYDLKSNVPKIYGGKRNFVSKSIEYGKKIWLEMGFKEMKGPFVISSFWNFDALFTPQDHPVREMQDTFFINLSGRLPDKKIVKEVKQAHEEGCCGSKGWGYEWDEEEAKKMVLRTHTTCLSALKLAELRDKKDKTGKFFSIGRCFRNETLDATHLFEFNQSEGIVIDPNVNFKHLLGYLKEFARRMGFEKIRFRPSYFPYTEPSVEGEIYDPIKKRWIEVIAAGILRPEVVVPLLGEDLPVLAWGPGFDRMIMRKYNLSDLRELYKNDLSTLRKMKEI